MEDIALNLVEWLRRIHVAKPHLGGTKDLVLFDRVIGVQCQFVSFACCSDFCVPDSHGETKIIFCGAVGF